MTYSYDSDDDTEPPFTVNTFIANVNALRPPPVPARVSNIHNTNQRNFITREDWLRIPEDVRAKLVGTQKPDPKKPA
jgi:hypothetical protein